MTERPNPERSPNPESFTMPMGGFIRYGLDDRGVDRFEGEWRYDPTSDPYTLTLAVKNSKGEDTDTHQIELDTIQEALTWSESLGEKPSRVHARVVTADVYGSPQLMLYVEVKESAETTFGNGPYFCYHLSSAQTYLNTLEHRLSEGIPKALSAELDGFLAQLLSE